MDGSGPEAVLVGMTVEPSPSRPGSQARSTEQTLAAVVRAQADALIERSYDLQEEIPPDLQRLTKDVAELARVLARVLEGKPALRAFGAPGDWGYGTPMGKALRGALDEAREARS